MRFFRLLIPALLLGSLAWAPGAQAVVAGTPASTNEYPYQTRVVMRATSGTYSCGGSVINATHVVTAAHCVYINDKLLAPANVSVGYGSTDRLALTAAAVSEVTMPTAYVSDDSYDVAVLELATPLNLTMPNVKAIPLTTDTELGAGVAAEAPATATGWGNLTENGPSPRYLQEVPLPLRDDAICSAFYAGSYVGSRTVCAGGTGDNPFNDNPDTCQGDSGGPLALDSGTGPELAGITSFGLGCGRVLTPAAYTEPSSPAIRPIIEGTAPSAGLLRGSAGKTTAGGAPAVTIPPAQAPAPPAPGAALRDTLRPTTRLSKLSCTTRRKCTFRVRAADVGGRVTKYSASVTRKVRTCRTRDGLRVCNTRTRKKVLKPRRSSGGFTFGATLVNASYKLSAVATDASGNRSRILSKTFRVR